MVPPTPLDTSPTIPPMPTQAKDTPTSTETGEVSLLRKNDLQQTDSAVPPSPSSREDRGGTTFFKPIEELLLLGVERAYRG